MSKRLLTSQGAALTRDVPHMAIQYRTFRLACRRYAATEFSMPAMSPTMTEGNITSWKIREGDKFSAGDVLLEIETDKAQMDVEAQDDGIMAKIIEGAGAKGVKVGTRIAITAGLEDNLQDLDLDSLGSSRTPAESQTSTTQEHTPKPQETSGKSGPSDKPDSASDGQESRYPLFPSVIQLLHQNRIAASEATKIPTSGPNGRLLKGDVLAYLGVIKADYPEQQSERIKNLGGLDLSNIEKLTATRTSDTTQAERKIQTDKAKDVPASADVTLPICLEAVYGVRQKLHNVLGVDIPTETFVARAASVCNEDLPRSRFFEPTADDLFNLVLGRQEPDIRPRSNLLIPRMQNIGTRPNSPVPSGRRRTDVLDELISSPKPQRRTRHNVSDAVTTRDSWFSVTVPVGDEARAKVFLQRLKTTLQVEPGRLVLQGAFCLAQSRKYPGVSRQSGRASIDETY